MKSCYIVLAIVFCVITVEGRNFPQHQDTNIDLNDNVDEKHVKNKPERRMRNRRQSYHNNYYDYVNSFQHVGVGDFLKDILFSVREIGTQVKQGVNNRFFPGHYDYRPNYSSACEDSLKELLTLYRELVSKLKPSPPPPTQIIYVPYPNPATFNNPVDKPQSNVSLLNRVIPNDKNQIWMVTPKNEDAEDDSDGSRPVSFRPKVPNKPHATPPPFEHGSTQEGIRTTTPSTLIKPGPCEAAILSCCGSKTEQEQERCFATYSCSKSYSTGIACNPDIIKMVLDNFSKMYGPINEF